MVRIIPAVSVVVTRGNTVLLVGRARPPSAGLHAFPGGRVEAGESLEEAARRELFEETGLCARELTPLREIAIAAESGGEAVAFRLHVFLAGQVHGEPIAGDDAASAAFYTLEEMAGMPLTDGIYEIAAQLRGRKA